MSKRMEQALSELDSTATEIREVHLECMRTKETAAAVANGGAPCEQVCVPDM